MFTKLSVLTSLILAASTLVRADVVPSEPGPGAQYTAGQTCTVSWEGDRDSNTVWKDMSIQLMTGDNFAMVHLTTVASGQDGTISGRFNFPCPEVDPYSAIYFYQFTSPHTDLKTWTTRFTITSPDGEVVPPENANQPDTGEPIPWGVGALADPSTAVEPPVIGGAAASGSNGPLALAPSGSLDSGDSTVPAQVTPTLTASSDGPSSATRPTASASASSDASRDDAEAGAALASSANFYLIAAVISAVSLFFMA